MPINIFVSADEEFQDLCFKFGLELDEVVSDKSIQYIHIYIFALYLFSDNLYFLL